MCRVKPKKKGKVDCEKCKPVKQITKLRIRKKKKKKVQKKCICRQDIK